MYVRQLFTLAALSIASSIAVAAQTPSGGPQADTYLAEDAQKSAALREGFASLIAPIAKQAEWVGTYGTATPSIAAELDGRQYLVYTGCKPHDCPAETYAVLYDTEAERMVAGAYVVNTFDAGAAVSSTVQWLGQPDFDRVRLLGKYLY